MIIISNDEAFAMKQFFQKLRTSKKVEQLKKHGMMIIMIDKHEAMALEQIFIETLHELEQIMMDTVDEYNQKINRLNCYQSPGNIHLRDSKNTLMAQTVIFLITKISIFFGLLHRKNA